MRPGSLGKVCVGGLLLLSMATGLAVAQTPVPIGAQFQINTFTTGSQQYPSVGVDAGGNLVVVWQSASSGGTDTSGTSIQGQLYDPAGAAVGVQFQVNTYTTSSQRFPSVGVDADGDFVVVWDSDGSEGTDTELFSVQAQRFDLSGNAVGAQFQVNTYTTSFQGRPSAAVDADGDFIVGWQSYGSSGTDTSLSSVQGQGFDAAGIAVATQFQVNTYMTSSQRSLSVAAGDDGNFVVVWISRGSEGTDASGYSIQGQRYDSAATSIGGQFQINTYTTGYQLRPSVGVDPDGEFVVAWYSYGSSGTDSSFASVQGQRFDAAGTEVGGEFQVNTYTTNFQGNPSVGVDPDGDFVVVWRRSYSSGTYIDSSGIQGQRFDAAGTAVGTEFQVNTYATNIQDFPSVAADAYGNFMVVWQSPGFGGTDTSDTSIQGQRFATPIFADGFEGGDVSAWSSTVP